MSSKACQEAHLAFKRSQAGVAALRESLRASYEDPAVREVLRETLRKARANVVVARTAWHEAVARDKVAKAPVRGKIATACPKPDGFKFLPWPKDVFRKAIDPTWQPTKTDLCMLGKYVFSTLREGRVQALVTVEARCSDVELRAALVTYFARPESRVYFGDVKILGMLRSARCPERVDVTISTDHKRIRGFIRKGAN